MRIYAVGDVIDTDELTYLGMLIGAANDSGGVRKKRSTVPAAEYIAALNPEKVNFFLTKEEALANIEKQDAEPFFRGNSLGYSSAVYYVEVKKHQVTEVISAEIPGFPIVRFDEPPSSLSAPPTYDIPELTVTKDSCNNFDEYLRCLQDQLVELKRTFGCAFDKELTPTVDTEDLVSFGLFKRTNPEAKKYKEGLEIAAGADRLVQDQIARFLITGDPTIPTAEATTIEDINGHGSNMRH